MEPHIVHHHVDLAAGRLVQQRADLDRLRFLGAKKPKSIKVCALLNKPARRQVDVVVDYVGFHIPNKFVVGYGLDYQQLYRNLPYLAVLEKVSEEGEPV